MNTKKPGANLLDVQSISTSPEIIKKVNGYNVILRFTTNNNEQIPVMIKELLVNSYAENLFSQNG